MKKGCPAYFDTQVNRGQCCTCPMCGFRSIEPPPLDSQHGRIQFSVDVYSSANFKRKITFNGTTHFAVPRPVLYVRLRNNLGDYCRGYLSSKFGGKGLSAALLKMLEDRDRRLVLKKKHGCLDLSY